MTKPKAIMLGVLSIWPFIYMLIFMAGFMAVFFSMGKQTQAQDGMPVLFMLVFPIHLFTMLEIIGLLIYFIVNLFKNELITQDKKPLWAIVLFLGNMIAMPIYWYLYIWKPLKASTQT